ncbi:DUF1822 family protein [Spirulina major]|uniref:DUF1822 family protein n=1 Tax=Spirulina major TaxID=270636 RepID=UPI0009334FB6|nr:DUF1822 family protein [Spirulina major]
MNLPNYSQSMMLEAPLPALELGIPPIAHQTALGFAAPHRGDRKRQQIYCNTLAVWMVNQHLNGFGIATDLPGSRAWQPTARALQDVADLYIPGFGHLACRPVLAGETQCYLPTTDQVGCVVVQLDAEFQVATLLGYCAVEPDSVMDVPLTALQDLTVLYDQLPTLETAGPRGAAAIHSLTDWLQGEIATTWEAIDRILTVPKPAFAMRSRSHAVERGKVFALDEGADPVALVVWVEQDPNAELDVAVELWPINPEHRLPPEVQLMLLDPDAEQLMAQAQGGGSERLQFRFTGEPGDRFDVKITHKTRILVESFVI